MRTLLASLAVAAVAATACSAASGRPTTAPPGGGTSVPAHPAASDQSKADASSAGSPQTAAGVPAGTGTGIAAGATASSADARKALDAYLGALARLDQPAALASSTGAAADLATLLTMSATVDRSEGGQTTLALQGAHFSPAAATADAATFDGGVTLAIEVTGSRGTARSQDTVAGPVQVVRTASGWRVSTFTYDGRPLVHVPEQARQVVDGIEFDVGSILSYGNLTAAIVGIGAQSGHADVTLATTSLSAGGPAAAGRGSFVNGPVVTGFLDYPRTAATPTRLDATFRTNLGTSVSFSVGLAGQPA